MTTHTPRFCPQCDDGTMLEYGMRDIVETLDGEPIYVPNVEAWHCPVCGEIEFARDNDGADRYSQALDAAQEKIQARKAQELRRARKALKLTQAEAGRLFGGGISAFSAYEHGKTQPHKSTVLLLRLLHKHPDLLAEIRAEPA